MGPVWSPMAGRTIPLSAEGTRRPRCERCRRPARACWCGYVRPVSTEHRVVVLQHPREARHRLGTVMILRQALPDVAVHVGIVFGDQPEVAAALTDARRPALLLFPGEGGVQMPPEGGPFTLVVPDGTWRQSRSLLAANPWLARLPQLSLSQHQASQYAVRTQPDRGCLSTVEAVAAALALLDDNPAIRRDLLVPFRALVGMHLACNDGGGEVLDDRAMLVRTGYLPPVP